ncbi:efflux RND transporter periplasmic adaptor subunit [Rubripirellula reticaptiva]|uniref:Peptidase family M50 n=1 Tax=Rubripirellula reticaptiva TaxID=2528013 RepID=A0A5C6EPB8_9BACT|nr:efflux RND transporter periplasmic adaptor subunit [Rubripirellula reticaptiva]TWU51603.1 Peptidase family M50 [Rubripirellula reticaptiva]
MNSQNPNDSEVAFDADTFELANTRLKLRRDLKIMPSSKDAETSYIVEDSVSSDFFQIGLTQYALMSLMDGNTTLHSAVSQIATRMGESAITMAEAADTCRWLIDSRLAVAVDSQGRTIDHVSGLQDQRSSARRAAATANANPLFLKVPLGSPGERFERFCIRFECVKRRFTLVLLAVLFFVAAWFVLDDRAAIAQSLDGVVSANSAVWLLATFIGLKIVHELGHAIVCDRLGGRVREFGVVFILFVPVPYVDVTSCWSFASRRHRIAVSAAGMLAELTVAAIAAIIWTHVTDPVMRFHLFNVMLTGSLTTLLFNANFLMRFDGYYLLSDMLDLPNLAASSRQVLSQLSNRWLLGRNTTLSMDIAHRWKTLIVYGIAASVWRVIVCIGLAVAAAHLMHGFGLILAIISLAMWWGIPALRTIRFLSQRTIQSANCRRYLLTRTAPCGFAMLTAAMIMPWPVGVSAPAVVGFANAETIRAGADGFVAELFVAEGQVVTPGQPLARLENVELLSQAKRMRATMEITRLRARKEQLAGNIATYQAEIATADALAARLSETESRIEQLTLRAPIAGTVMTLDSRRRLNDQMGVYLSEGNAILQIVDPANKEVIVSIAQNDGEYFAERLGREVRFVSSSFPSDVTATLTLIQPHAEIKTDPRLMASGGGPLAVRHAAGVGSADTRSASTESADDVELVQPRFAARALLSNADRLPAGVTGQVEPGRYPRSVATKIWSLADDYAGKIALW